MKGELITPEQVGSFYKLAEKKFKSPTTAWTWLRHDYAFKYPPHILASMYDEIMAALKALPDKEKPE